MVGEMQIIPAIPGVRLELSAVPGVLIPGVPEHAEETMHLHLCANRIWTQQGSFGQLIFMVSMVF